MQGTCQNDDNLFHQNPAKKQADILIFQLKDYHTAFNKEEQVLVNF